MIFLKKITLLFILLFAIVLFAKAQQKVEKPPLTRILFILDASQSMLTEWETGTKMTVARELLTELVDSLSNINHVEMALRVYGHQKPVPPQDCNDTKLEVPFSKRNTQKIKSKLRSLRPKGTTPIARSLELSINDFPECKECRNIIILITDGIESCNGDPCAVSLQLQKRGIVLKPFVIGIGLDEEFKDSFDCVGRYYNAANEDRFKEILDVVVSQALNSTTVQVDLLDRNNKPTESNVNMSFYDMYTGELLNNFMHTINHLGNPDTLSLDPVITYKIQVHTMPEVWADSIEIIPREHNTIKIKTPQGKLVVKSLNNDYYKNLEVLVKQKDSSQIINVQQVNQTHKYITGKYSIEVLTIPRLKINDLEIAQSKTSFIMIPEPGLITFEGSANAYGSIYKVEGNKMVNIYNLDSEVRFQTIPILPGTYRVVSRPINARESVFTSDIEFTVKAKIANKIVLF
ncbi:MAG: VWA domain-containing protein [Salinivirgaceae bacterium]|jgi:Ca-activated chloride channel family protein|nr:VWA domain-containing protein [Salinivirgaceae bacterium]